MTESLLTFFSQHPYLWPCIVLVAVLVGVWNGIVERSKEVTKENLTFDTLCAVAGVICLAQALAGIFDAVWLHFYTRYVTPPVNVSAIGLIGLSRVKFLDFQLLIVISVGVALPVLHIMSADRNDLAFRFSRTCMLAIAAGSVLSSVFVAYAALIEPDLITALPVQGQTPREVFLWWYSAVPFYIFPSAFVALALAIGLKFSWRALRRSPG